MRCLRDACRVLTEPAMRGVDGVRRDRGRVLRTGARGAGQAYLRDNIQYSSASAKRPGLRRYYELAAEARRRRSGRRPLVFY